MTSKAKPPSDKAKAQAGHSPPSYATLFPQPADAALNDSPQASHPRQPTSASAQEVENINTLREANPRLALDPPLPQSTRFETAQAAAATAVLGVGNAFNAFMQDNNDPTPAAALVAAHTAHAIALAVSTSRSYTAFVAAATAAESAALIMAESFGQKTPEARLDADAFEARLAERVDNAIWRAVESALAAEAGNTAHGTWPSNTHDTDASTAAPGNQD